MALALAAVLVGVCVGSAACSGFGLAAGALASCGGALSAGCGCACLVILVPHSGQNSAPSSIFFPHSGQNIRTPFGAVLRGGCYLGTILKRINELVGLAFGVDSCVGVVCPSGTDLRDSLSDEVCLALFEDHQGNGDDLARGKRDPDSGLKRIQEQENADKC